jgi:hypothetical protein
MSLIPKEIFIQYKGKAVDISKLENLNSSLLMTKVPRKYSNGIPTDFVYLADYVEFESLVDAITSDKRWARFKSFNGGLVSRELGNYSDYWYCLACEEVKPLCRK